MAQRVARMELEANSEGSVRERALEAWAAKVESERENLAARIKRKLGREVTSFPPPIKGFMIVAEVDGLIFEGGATELGLCVQCPVCDEVKGYSIEDPESRLTIFEQLGRLLANAEQDRRCDSCVKANRRDP